MHNFFNLHQILYWQFYTNTAGYALLQIMIPNM